MGPPTRHPNHFFHNSPSDDLDTIHIPSDIHNHISLILHTRCPPHCSTCSPILIHQILVTMV